MILFFMLMVTLILRAVLWSADGQPTGIQLTVAGLVLLLSTLLCITGENWIFLCVNYLLIVGIHFCLELFISRFPAKKYLWRILALSLSLLSIFSLLTINSAYQQGSLLGMVFRLISGIYPGILESFVHASFVVISGLFLVIFEVNHLIRFILGVCHLPPAGVKQKSNEQTLARGKIIGYAERSLIFTLVLLNQIGAVGFVMAAKALARFKEMEKKEWAEYVLIGTLISTVLSFAISLAVKAFL